MKRPAAVLVFFLPGVVPRVLPGVVPGILIYRMCRASCAVPYVFANSGGCYTAKSNIDSGHVAWLCGAIIGLHLACPIPP